MASETVFTIMTICTGNICRSPLAEFALRKGLSHLSRLAVVSAGTHAVVGHRVPRQTELIAERAGLDTSAHRARQLTQADLGSANLVLGLAREHRADAVRLWPKATRASFTLLEFARLVKLVEDGELAESARGDDTRSRLASAVSLVASKRGTARRPEDPFLDDVIDPYGLPDEVYERSASQIFPAVETIVDFLRAAETQG